MKDFCLLKSYDYEGDGLDLAELFADEPYAFFLDSSLRQTQRGRYSFLGFDPFLVLKGNNEHNLTNLRKQFNPFFGSFDKFPTPFAAGAVGFLSYDFGLKLENIRVQTIPGEEAVDYLFGFYDCVITLDHLDNKLYVTSTGWPEKDPLLRKKRAQNRLDAIVRRLANRPANKE